MMSLSIRSALAGLLAFALVVPAASAPPTLPPPAEDVFRLEASRDDDGALVLSWTIAPGNYLYRDSLVAMLDGEAVSLSTPPGEREDDPTFGPVDVYRDTLRLRLAELPSSGHLEITYRGCAEASICYPPLTDVVDLASLTVSPLALGPQNGGARRQRDTALLRVQQRAS